MVVLLLFLWTVTLRQIVFNTTSAVVIIDFSWLTCLQKNAQKFEKKLASLNFHKRKETDADFATIEFGRRGTLFTETHVNNLKLKFNSSQPWYQNGSVQLISNESIISRAWTTWIHVVHSL